MFQKIRLFIKKMQGIQHKSFAKLDTQSLFDLEKLNGITHSFELQVPKSEVYCISQHGSEVILLDSGTYQLSDLILLNFDPEREAIIYRFNIRHSLSRSWNVYLKDHHLTLSGNYQLSIRSPSDFYHYLKVHDIIANNTDFDRVISQHITSTITIQNISSEEIQENTEKFSQFINDILQPVWLKNGINLLNFSLGLAEPYDYEKDSSAQTNQLPTNGSTADEIAENVDAISEDTDTQESNINNKIYFLVENGTQIGPFTLNKIQLDINKGIIKPHYLVWKHGSASWKKADKFPEFRWNE